MLYAWGSCKSWESSSEGAYKPSLRLKEVSFHIWQSLPYEGLSLPHGVKETLLLDATHHKEMRARLRPDLGDDDQNIIQTLRYLMYYHPHSVEDKQAVVFGATQEQQNDMKTYLAR
jgi:hypothetical protein